MFQLGQTYDLRMWEDDGEACYWNCKVVELDMPVVKFDHGGDEMIVNVSSRAFMRATPSQTSD